MKFKVGDWSMTAASGHGRRVDRELEVRTRSWVDQFRHHDLIVIFIAVCSIEIWASGSLDVSFMGASLFASTPL